MGLPLGHRGGSGRMGGFDYIEEKEGREPGNEQMRELKGQDGEKNE